MDIKDNDLNNSILMKILYHDRFSWMSQIFTVIIVPNGQRRRDRRSRGEELGRERRRTRPAPPERQRPRRRHFPRTQRAVAGQSAQVEEAFAVRGRAVRRLRPGRPAEPVH